MSLLSNLVFTSKAGETEARSIAVWQHLPQYIVCCGLGLLGGAIGVALAIGLAIIIQALLPAATIFSPGVVPFAITSVTFGLGVSWLLGWVARHIFSDSFYQSDRYGMQVILIFSAFTGLLEAVLFMQGL